MFVRVLGPIDASQHEHPVRLSRRERALLAVLALHAGRTVPWDTLADGVFGSEVPQQVRHALATLASRLRGRLGDEKILTDAGGYRLNTDFVVLDVDIFERAVHTRQGLDDALRLWRGPPYADLEDWTPAVAARARLEELFWTGEEDRARQGLAAGTSGLLIAELTSMTAAHPYREQRWVLLIQSLASVGRQADALAAYQRARTLLADDLGLEPGPALVAAERAVLLGAPAGAPAPLIEETPSSWVGRAHLPVATVRLIGRDDDVAAVAALVHGERLLTLTGPGGVGKTELALAATTAIEGRFSDGAWWVDLATLDPGRDVGPMVSAVLGVRERREADVVDVIAEALGARHVLVVTDNCEHVLASTAALVGGLLRRCPNVKVLATSRRRLGVHGERTFAVRPLRVGGIDAPAFELLTDRIGDSFDDDAGQQGALEEIARRLDGVPLALELAASRCRTMTPSDVLARMLDQVRFVEPPGVEGERSTLWGALRWSSELMEPGVQEGFNRVSVFAGSFSLGASEVVAGALDRMGVDDAISELVEASLIEHDAGRYRLLETTRQFGRDLLVSHGQADHVLDRHLAWILDAVAEARVGLRGPDELLWVQRVDEQWSDIRAAFHRALERDDPSAAILLASHLVYDAFWRRPEALGWIVEANRRFGDIPHPQQAALLGAAGVAAWALGDAHEAVALGRRASALVSASEPAFDRLPAWALATGLAWVGDLTGAIEVSFQTAESLDDDPYLQAVWLSNLAATNVFAGRVDSAKAPAERAVTIARARGNPTLLAYCSMFQALSLMMEPPIAHKLFGDAARLAVGVRNRFIERDAASVECVYSMILGTPPQDVLDRLLQFAEARQRGGWILHTWMEFGRIAEVLAAVDRPADAAVVALATLRSPAGPQMASSLNDLLQRLAAELSHDMTELEDRAASLDLKAVLALAASKA